ncbi:hypothetical protein PDJAM_G00067740 [Pangasius djambal]|uniref:Uncharacterized protein n=1 Tax=Pangasius djambal TaxID=1691987 RepID=A0ACC5YZY8_9TELE|nr:hypothetical protein [Pangasius djambal]
MMTTITTNFQIRRTEHSATTVGLKNGKHLWLRVKTLGLLNASVLLTLCSSAYWYERYRPTVSTVSCEGTGSENLFVVVTPLPTLLDFSLCLSFLPDVHRYF